jgi:hypothetical protein
MEAILKLYQQPYDPKHPLVCFDEKSMQLLAHIAPMRLAEPGHPVRQDYEYKREGTSNLFLFVEPKAGFRQVLVTNRRTKQDFAYAMRYLVDVLYPDVERIDVVMDNLNTHHYHSLVESGQSHLICGGEDFEKVLIVPSGLELFGSDAAFGSFFLFEQVESDMSQDSQIFRRMVFPNAASVFVQSHVQYPM